MWNNARSLLDRFGCWWSRRPDETPRCIEWDKFRIEELGRRPFETRLDSPDADPQEVVNILSDLSGLVEACPWSPVATLLPAKYATVKSLEPGPCPLRQLTGTVKYTAAAAIVPYYVSEATVQMLFAGSRDIRDGYFLSGKLLLSSAKNSDVAQFTARFADLRSRVDLVTTEQLALGELGRALQQGEETIGLLDMHSEQTVLCIIDRSDLWFKKLPIGGDTFTQQLMKTVQRSFDDVDSLKCQAFEQAPNPKQVFQAMLPAFDDLVTEVTKARNSQTKATSYQPIPRLYLTGGPTKLPGLGKFLESKLGGEVCDLPIDSFNIDSGGQAISEEFLPATIAAIQRLGYGNLRTNFLRNSRGFGPKAKSAWGIHVRNREISYVKVVKKSR